MLSALLEAHPLEPNQNGHTLEDDFEHFCAYSGLSEKAVGPIAFAWAKLAYFNGTGPRPALQHGLTYDAFMSQLGMLLRDEPAGRVALLTDYAIAWWSGREIVFAYLRDEDPGQVDEEFNLDDCHWEEWKPRLIAWLAKPVFVDRPQVAEWRSDAPPFDAP
ncbi:hypothetical protein [Caballeronia sp. GACF4]|uniref:hypothetical protein n=1 Tax=Caballeronia sp. GACF4 TaxID=2921763 RepID=UPI002027A152|nr:hypothetical protein [Caballeronia sp. GACF4]